MYCSKCGVQNSDEATQCINCDSVLINTTQQAAVQGIPFIPFERKTCGLATAAFVMGLLSLTLYLWFFLALPAIICGIIALVKIKNSNGQLKGTGFAVAGLLIPVVLAIVLAILMPEMGKVRGVAKRVVCGTNLKGLSTAMVVYTNDYDKLPSENWCDLLIEEADVTPESFICMNSDAIEGESSYAMNIYIVDMKLDDLPDDIVLFFETNMGVENGPRNTPIQTRRYFEFLNEFGKIHNENSMVYKDRFNQLGGPEDILLRHNESRPSGCNIVFADGHTEFVPEDGIDDLKWTVE